MSDGTFDELAALRARAYGPDADIQDDPSAVERLAELEAFVRSTRDAGAESPEPELVPELKPELVTAVAPESLTALASEPEPAAEPTSAARARPKWVLRVAWAASLVLAVVIAVVTTTTLTAPVTPLAPLARNADVRQVATLLVDADFEWNGFGGNSAVESYGFDTIAGMRAIALDGEMGMPGTDSCFVIVEDSLIDPQADYFEGQTFWGCGASPFPAVITLSVSTESPRPLQDAYAVGTALQFVLDGSRIAVYLAEPSAVSEPGETPEVS